MRPHRLFPPLPKFKSKPQPDIPGSRYVEQLIAEGLIPPGFVWPVGLELSLDGWPDPATHCSGARLPGVPKAVAAPWRLLGLGRGDRRGFASGDGVPPSALQKALRANSPEGWAESERFCDARRDERFLCVPGCPFPAHEEGAEMSARNESLPADLPGAGYGL